MVVSLLALSQTPFCSSHQQQLAANLFYARPDLSLDVQYLAESSLRIVCRDLETARSLTSLVRSFLLDERNDVQVLVETFDVLIDGLAACRHLSLDDLVQENLLSMDQSDILDVQRTPSDSYIIRFLRLGPADSTLVRGISYDGDHYSCKPVDAYDRGAFWCYRCGQIFCLADGGPCSRKKPSCRYCGQESHMSRACPHKDLPDFTPSCNPCKSARGVAHINHVAWDAMRCKNSWHRRSTHPESKFTLKRKRMERSSPRVLRHRPTPSGQSSRLIATTSTHIVPVAASSWAPPLCNTSPSSPTTLLNPSTPDMPFELPLCPVSASPIDQSAASLPKQFSPLPFDVSHQQAHDTWSFSPTLLSCFTSGGAVNSMPCDTQPTNTMPEDLSARCASAPAANPSEPITQVASSCSPQRPSAAADLFLPQPPSTTSTLDDFDWETFVGHFASPLPFQLNDEMETFLASTM